MSPLTRSRAVPGGRTASGRTSAGTALGSTRRVAGSGDRAPVLAPAFAPFFAPVLATLAVIAVLAAIMGASGAGWIAGPSRMLADARFALATRAPVTPTVLVAIDAHSLSAIDVWPWPRSRHAELIDRLNGMGAAEIHFDIDFSSPSHPLHDAMLAEALERSAAYVTLAAHAQRTSAGLIERLPLPALAAHASTASVVVRAGPDGLVRHAERGRLLGGVPTPSLASMVAGMPPAPGGFTIDYSIDASAIPVVPFADVLDGTADPAVIKGMRVVVGATAVELGDMLAVPHLGVMPGALVQVLAGETLAQDRVPMPVPHALAAGLALVLLVGLGLLLAMGRGVIDVGPALAGVGAATGALALLDAHLFVCHARTLPSVEIGMGLLAVALAVVMVEIARRRMREAAETRRAENAARVLDRVVADNFDGILVYDEEGGVLSVSTVARRLMRDVLAIDVDRCDVLTATLSGDVRNEMTRPARLLREGRWEARPPTARRFTDASGRIRHLEYVLTPSWTSAEREDASVVTTLTLRDVTERVASRERMDWLARYDEPTGALKPHALSALIDAREPDEDGALVAFDLRRFAVVRRTLGRGRSDGLLARVVECVQALVCVRAIARTADGEFVAWIGPARGGTSAVADEPFEALAAAEAVREAVRKGLGATASTVRMAIPTGVLIPTGTRRDADGAGGDDRPFCGARDGRRAIEAAVTAKDVASRRGDAVVRHEPAMDEAAARRLTLEADLPAAIARGGRPGGLSVAYQPQVDLATGRTVGVEALARWIHPELGFVPPDEFIEVAEAAGRIADLGAWILARACRDMAGVNERLADPLRVAVNVSPQQFIQSDVGAAVRAALDASALPPSLLKLEITESLAVNDPAVVAETLAPWRDRGVRVALDDFGTGYAQLGVLSDLPIDEIKLDRSLVAPPAGHPRDLAGRRRADHRGRTWADDGGRGDRGRADRRAAAWRGLPRGAGLPLEPPAGAGEPRRMAGRTRGSGGLTPRPYVNAAGRAGRRCRSACRALVPLRVPGVGAAPRAGRQ